MNIQPTPLKFMTMWLARGVTSMVNTANNHGLVAINNKLFVIKYVGGVYDSYNGEFAIMKNTKKVSFVGTFRAVSLVDKIIVFEEDETEV